MAWVRSRFREIEPTVIWHNGQTGGFSSFLGFTEDGRFGMVVLSNGKEIVDRLGGDLLRDVIALESGG